MASYYRRKNGTFCIRVSNGKPGGKQVRISTTYKPPVGISAKAADKAAMEYAAMFELAVHEGTYVPGKKQKNPLSGIMGITLSDFVTQYYYIRVENRLSPNTLRFYESVIEQFILPSFGSVRVKDISSQHLQAFIDYLAASGSRADQSNADPLSGATIKRYATVFSSVMTEAFKMGLAEKDVLHQQYISYPPIHRKQIQAYDDEEAKAFFDGLADEHPKIRALLLTSLLLGLRRGEVVGLKWGDFDFKNSSLNIVRSAYKPKGKPQTVKTPKSNCSVRTVFFSDSYAEIMMTWKEEQGREKERIGAVWKEQDFVFTNEFGDMISIYAPTEICAEFEEKCGLRHLKLHGLRHTCGSLMIKNGVDIETVKSFFGHESIRTTQQYLSAYDSSKKNAANLLASAIIK